MTYVKKVSGKRKKGKISSVVRDNDPKVAGIIRLSDGFYTVDGSTTI